MQKQWLLFLLLFLPACDGASQQSKEPKAYYKALCNLVDSTTIIQKFITKNELQTVLQDVDPEQLEVFIANVSPAKMAFEAEVLACTVPYILVYYYQNSPQQKEFLQQLDDLIAGYDDNKIKCVIIDVDHLWGLAQDADIEEVPTLITVSNRKIMEKITENISIDLVEKKLSEN